MHVLAWEVGPSAQHHLSHKAAESERQTDARLCAPASESPMHTQRPMERQGLVTEASPGAVQCRNEGTLSCPAGLPIQGQLAQLCDSHTANKGRQVSSRGLLPRIKTQHSGRREKKGTLVSHLKIPGREGHKGLRTQQPAPGSAGDNRGSQWNGKSRDTG